MNRISAIKRRADFLACAASGHKFVKNSIVVQIRRRAEGEYSASVIRVGFTVTKKVGNAVIRNRVKRRMRSAVAQLLPQMGASGCDYVFIGREAAYKGSFDDLIQDMKHALKRLAIIVAESGVC